MAEKRMFAKSIVLTDAFLDMPMSARCLYFTLGMLADDDGFVGSPKSIMRQCGASMDDMKILLSKRYVLGFDSGVIVIKHWRLHNTLKNDRYHPTTYQEELAALTTDQKGAYIEAGNQIPEQCFQDGSNMDPEWNQSGSPDKYSIEENSIDKNSKEKAHAHGEYGWVKLTDAQYQKLVADLGQKELDRCIQYIDESAQSNGNKNKWKDWNLTIRKCSRDGWGLREKRQESRNAPAACKPIPAADPNDLWRRVNVI